jgi:hypothetical protein
MNVQHIGPFPVVVTALGLTLGHGQTTDEAAAAVQDEHGLTAPPVLDRAVLEGLLLQSDRFVPADDEAAAVLADLVALAHPELVAATPAPEPAPALEAATDPTPTPARQAR